MPTITPFLWFDSQAEEAMNFYISIFFELEGQKLMGLNAGPQFKFTEAISLFVDCETQEEVDELWEKLSEGGTNTACHGRSFQRPWAS